MTTGPEAAIVIGTAGWSIPAPHQHAFAPDGSHLQRYAEVFPGVEVNSSFHRPHRLSTYQRWAAAVPEGFRFSVKLPKAITHVRKLVDAQALLAGFLAQVAGLGGKLGPLLVQLPPSLAFDVGVAERFLIHLRDRVSGPVVLEPRHATWFQPEADALLALFRIGRVGADPAPVPQASRPGGWAGLRYLRLHGSPRIYHSPYPDDAIRAALNSLSAERTAGDAAWCIFDNTASGAATLNALTARALAGL